MPTSLRDAPVVHLYVHIPFCPKKCSYCAFETHIGSVKLVQLYVDAVCLDVQRISRERAGGPLDTVYFGGGTPSMLEPSEIGKILATVDEEMGIAAGCEITLEAHPATVDAQKLRGFRSAGVTRVSFGGESLDSGELRAIGRSHTVDGVLRAVNGCRHAGFQNVGLDLMYGLPGQTSASWEGTLQSARSVGVDHLSLYPLSIEPRTVFARRLRNFTLDLPDDDAVVAMYDLACTALRAATYEHYEVANWAQDGKRCRHNIAYWHNREFFAVGVAAHGYLHPYRTENIRGTKRYIDRLSGGGSPVVHREHIDLSTHITESAILGLRLLTDGLALNDLSRKYDVNISQLFSAELADLHARGLITVHDDRIRLREKAVPLANEVWERFVA